MSLPRSEREWDFDADRDMGERDTEPAYEWTGSECVCPNCGRLKSVNRDECDMCWKSGRLRDWDKHGGQEEG